MTDVKLDLRPNGPILVSGPVTLNDPEGNAYDLAGKETFALCRCGHSSKKPFCDGAHKTSGFESNDSANPA